MLVFLAPLFFFGFIAAVIAFLAYSRKLHFKSTSAQLRARICISFLLFLQYAVIVIFTAAEISHIVLILPFVPFVAWDLCDMYYLCKALPKVCRLEGMGVSYVKPYWEKQEGERQPA